MRGLLAPIARVHVSSSGIRAPAHKQALSQTRGPPLSGAFVSRTRRAGGALGSACRPRSRNSLADRPPRPIPLAEQLPRRRVRIPPAGGGGRRGRALPRGRARVLARRHGAALAGRRGLPPAARRRRRCSASSAAPASSACSRTCRGTTTATASRSARRSTSRFPNERPSSRKATASSGSIPSTRARQARAGRDVETPRGAAGADARARARVRRSTPRPLRVRGRVRGGAEAERLRTAMTKPSGLTAGRFAAAPVDGGPSVRQSRQCRRSREIRAA